MENHDEQILSSEIERDLANVNYFLPNMSFALHLLELISSYYTISYMSAYKAWEMECQEGRWRVIKKFCSSDITRYILITALNSRIHRWERFCFYLSVIKASLWYEYICCKCMYVQPKLLTVHSSAQTWEYGALPIFQKHAQGRSRLLRSETAEVLCILDRMKLF